MILPQKTMNRKLRTAMLARNVNINSEVFKKQMSTFISVNTYAYSVTFLTDKMMSSLKLIIILSGLDPSKYLSDWVVVERGIKKWLETRYLESVVLEVFNPRTDKLVGRWDFDINYSYTVMPMAPCG